MADGLAYRPVEAPDLTRPRPHGIVSVARPIPVADTADVLSGISYPADCDSDYQIDLGPCGPIGPDAPSATLSKFRRDPFTVSVADICGLGYSRAVQRARARAKLARMESSALAGVLAAGGLVQSFDTQPNVEILAPSPVSLGCAIGLVDAWGAERGLPTVAYAPIESSGSWPDSALADLSGVLTSRTGTRVALAPFIGNIQPQNGPPAPWWLWATGPIRLFRGPVEDSYESIPTENTYIARAHRSIIPDWACAIAAVPLADFCEGAA